MSFDINNDNNFKTLTVPNAYILAYQKELSKMKESGLESITIDVFKDVWKKSKEDNDSRYTDAVKEHKKLKESLEKWKNENPDKVKILQEEKDRKRIEVKNKIVDDDDHY